MESLGHLNRDELRYLLAVVDGDYTYDGPLLHMTGSVRVLIPSVRALGAYPRDQWGMKVREAIAALPPV